SSRQIAPLFRGMCAAAACLPTQWIRPVLLLAPPLLRLVEGLSKAQAELMTLMLRENDPRQTRWSARAILGWSAPQLPNCQVISIHGNPDHVIPMQNGPHDPVVEGGRHLISLTHAPQINRFLAAYLTGCERRRSTL